jgi:hypothetical protein
MSVEEAFEREVKTAPLPENGDNMNNSEKVLYLFLQKYYLGTGICFHITTGSGLTLNSTKLASLRCDICHSIIWKEKFIMSDWDFSKHECKSNSKVTNPMVFFLDAFRNQVAQEIIETLLPSL